MSSLSTRGLAPMPSAAVRTVESELVIGAHALPGKDATVLQVLVRLLDGSMSHRLRFSEQLEACNIVFCAPEFADTLPGVVVQVADHSHPSNAQSGAIEVPTPLRMSHVMGALHQALALIHRPTVADPAAGLRALFDRVRHCMGGPSRSVVPLDSGHMVLIDTQRGRLQTAEPLEQLLAGQCQPGDPRPAGRRDEELLHTSPSHALRDFVWRLAQRLADVGVAPPPLPGAWRLRRWPEAAGLKSPGHPRLAALMTAHHYTVDELGAASGLPSLTVQWFVQCCQLFGLVEHRDAIASNASSTASAHKAPPGWLGQLRERLRLW